MSDVTQGSPAGPAQPRVISRGQWVALAFAGLLVVGSIGPWARAFIVTINGTDGDGVITLFAGVIAAVLVFVSAQQKRWPLIVSALLALLALVVGTIDLVRLEDASGTTDFFGEDVQLVQVQWGLYAVVLGALGLSIASAVEWRRLR